jgi:hypothetical protein
MSSRWRTEKPGADEHAAYYAGYIAEAPEGDLVERLELQGGELGTFVRGIPESRGDYRYAEGKWSIKDVVLHLCDAERVFTYRLLRFARNDATDLPGFDEGTFAANGGAASHTLAQLAEEFEAVRRASLALIAPMDDAQMMRRGTANGNAISARAIAWILAGHAAHHQKVLRERYLPA